MILGTSCYRHVLVFIIKVGNSDDRFYNCPPQDCLPVDNSEVGNPEGIRVLGARWQVAMSGRCMSFHIHTAES